MADLPCDADGMCMVCKVVPPDEDVLLCSSCTSPWHMQCLKPPLTSVPLGDWECPDCNMPIAMAEAEAEAENLKRTSSKTQVPSSPSTGGNDMVGKIMAIMADPTLSEAEKARKRQELMGNKSAPAAQQGKGGENGQKSKPAVKERRNETMEMLDQNLNCIFCMNLAERPVTTPCGHNFCLKCFQRWIGQGKKSCGKCRAPIPASMANQPRINAAMVMAIRLAKAATTSTGPKGPPKQYHHIMNENRPDKCFTTDRAVKTGKANAASGKIFVTIAPDHFGPILAENDPVRGQGVLVGESWEDRMECRQWGAHFPHVAGIAGQSDYGAQSVALSGGYEDDEDHGEWFLYTGSGGRDLSGNKRTNKEQSFDQKFDKSNEALRVSCKRGYPVRVVRSHKEKRSSYAPEKGVRYDGVYRIEKCWRKKGIQGHKVCRYLFVRCDNEPAPWTSDEIGDRKRSLPVIDELKEATEVFERKSEPAWDLKEESETWGWTKDPPDSRKTGGGGGTGEKGSRKKHLTVQQKLLREFGCSLCRKVMELPLSTPCGHNFCKSCLVDVFSGQDDMRERKAVGGRSLRVQKVVKRCPTCKGDITDFITNPQVNRQLEDLIRSLQNSIAEDENYEQEPKADTNMAEKDTEDQGEVGEQIVRDSDDESDSPALPAVKESSKSTENGHAKLNSEGNSKPIDNGHTGPAADGHSNSVASEKVSEPLPNEQSTGQAPEKLVGQPTNRPDSSVHCKDTLTQHLPILPSAKPAKAATKTPKKRKARVVKDSDEESSDVDSEDSEFEIPVKHKKAKPSEGVVSNKSRNSRQKSENQLVVSDSEEETPAITKKSARESGGNITVVLDSEDETEAIDTPSRRLTRGQHAASVARKVPTRTGRKALGGSIADAITF